MTVSTRTIDLHNDLTVSVAEYGENSDGTAVLVLHGGAGPRSVAGFAEAMSEHAYTIVPTHPGFDGRPRPDATDSIADLATAYLDLLDELNLRHVVVVGSSFGGWVAAEMGLRDNHDRISCLVLLGASGIKPEPPLEIADPVQLGPVRTGELAFHNPQFRLNPATLSEEQRAVMAANQRTQAIYGGEDVYYDPKLRGRLHRITKPVLVLAGEQDGVVPPDYQRTLAGSFPRATFRVIPEAAHFPHIEQPGAVFDALGEFVDNQVKAQA